MEKKVKICAAAGISAEVAYFISAALFLALQKDRTLDGGGVTMPSCVKIDGVSSWDLPSSCAVHVSKEQGAAGNVSDMRGALPCGLYRKLFLRKPMVSRAGRLRSRIYDNVHILTA